MDYERLYKGALSRAKKLKETCDSTAVVGWCEYLFPELRESEDERIREDLIGYFKDKAFLCHKKEDIIAWLEKQGEQEKSYDTCDSSMMDNKKPPYGEKRDFGYFEEKLADKAGPKFKVGDWVVTSYGKVNQVVAIDDDCDGFTLDDYTYFSGSWKDDYHLWTIQDAKDGDVLVVPSVKGSEHSEQIFIFKEIKDRDYVKNAVEYYCRCMDNEFASNERSFMGQSDDYFTPATKEQRDLLFQKMKEAGYEWDAEEKELRKIKQATMLETFEIEHIEDGKYYYCIKDYYAGGNKRASKGDIIQAKRGMSMMALGVKANEYFIPVNSVRIDKVAWSEEDEEYLKDAVNYFNVDDALQHKEKEIIRWLKSLKQRIGG